MSIDKIPGKVWIILKKIRKRVLRAVMKPLFRRCGKNVWFDPDDFLAYDKISIGNDVFIGPGAQLQTITEISIGNQVMFGPNVTILGGNHNTELSGIPMFHIKQKREFDDQPVFIEDDVWIGSRAILLKGVRIGRGAVVGAGSVVTKNVPPYAVVVGNPARVVKYRGSRDEIARHEEQLYPPERRIDVTQLPEPLPKQGA